MLSMCTRGLVLPGLVHRGMVCGSTWYVNPGPSVSKADVLTAALWSHPIEYMFLEGQNLAFLMIIGVQAIYIHPVYI